MFGHLSMKTILSKIFLKQLSEEFIWFDFSLKMISSLEIVNSQFEYSRRPLKDDFLYEYILLLKWMLNIYLNRLIVSLESFQMFGIANQSNEFSRPLLIQSFIKSEENIFHLEFETNPLNSISDYRIQGITQPLQITYHPVTI